jgi:hypothetical protein
MAGGEPFNCPDCNMSYSERRRLVRHIKMHHTQVGPLQHKMSVFEIPCEKDAQLFIPGPGSAYLILPGQDRIRA